MLIVCTLASRRLVSSGFAMGTGVNVRGPLPFSMQARLYVDLHTAGKAKAEISEASKQVVGFDSMSLRHFTGLNFKLGRSGPLLTVRHICLASGSAGLCA